LASASGRHQEDEVKIDHRRLLAKAWEAVQVALVVIVLLAMVSCFYALDKFRWTL
jgi:hypothetical protein